MSEILQHVVICISDRRRGLSDMHPCTAFGSCGLGTKTFQGGRGSAHSSLDRHSLLGCMHREMHAVASEGSAVFPAVGGFWRWSANSSGVSLISGNVFIFLIFASFDFYLVKCFLFEYLLLWFRSSLTCWSQLWGLENRDSLKRCLNARSVVYESNTWGPPQV